MSEDEKVTRDILLHEAPNGVVQVADAKNLKRSLLITLQLAEMHLPSVLALNMTDEAMDKGITIDLPKLKKMLGIEVVSTIAPQRKGIKELREGMTSPRRATVTVSYHPVIEEYAAHIAEKLPPAPISGRSLALMILSEDISLREWLKSNVDEPVLRAIEQLRDDCFVKLRTNAAYLINTARIEAAEAIASAVMKKAAAGGGKALDLVGRMCMHPYWASGAAGGALYCVPVCRQIRGRYAGRLFPEYDFWRVSQSCGRRSGEKDDTVPFLQELLVGEYGLITVALTYAIAIILPITVTFFIAFALLEDSGYLPRLAIMSNRLFNIMGLNGKAVLPMVLGLGCGTMAVMTSRILEKSVTASSPRFCWHLQFPVPRSLASFSACLARCPLWRHWSWSGSILIVLFISGFLASKIVKGERTEFFLEIPPIGCPSS